LQAYRDQDDVTLLFREFILEDFTNGPISDDYLAQMRQDFDVVREAGFMVFVRFAYTQRDTPPYHDAPKPIVLAHIAQLAPLLQEYSDIIKVVQAGFIGSWGEWYFTDYFGQDDISEQNYQDRLDVVTALLHAMPPETLLQLRTPVYKQHFYPNETLSAATAYNGSDAARVGFHNDCFLASADDYGTFQNDAERAYMASETLFTPMGGETCGVNPPRSSCASAMDEMALYHWSFLNIDYHEGVLNNWVKEGCFQQIQRQLGYRFTLQQASFSQRALPGGPFRLTLALKNVGWAGIFFKTQMVFVMRHKESQQEYRFTVEDDPRTWLPSDNPYTIAHTLCLPKDLPTGQYDLLLHLAPTDAQDQARYAIQLGNELNWEPETGLNNLGYAFDVQHEAPADNCIGN
jgi:hypothetical protein